MKSEIEQMCFFGTPAEPHAPASRHSQPAPREPGIKKQLETVRRQLASAVQDLADADSNIAELWMYESASEQGRIDDNWWQGGIQFGCLDSDWDTERTDGKFPIKIRRWLRHLRFDQHKQRQGALAAIGNLTPTRDRLTMLVKSLQLT